MLLVSSIAGAQSAESNDTKPSAPTAPTVVTPGKAGSPPSDAIVLFDGTQMDAWQSQDGPAKWSLLESEGAMEVKKAPDPFALSPLLGMWLTAY